MLAGRGHRTAAIYLWGYVAEMTLKAAYFSFTGLTEGSEITVAGHIRPAIARGKAAPLRIAWPGGGHNVRAWAELLVGVRAMDPTTAYTPDIEERVQSSGQRIGHLWRETLRYHKNRAYLYEVQQVHSATEWLLIHSHEL